MFFCSDLQGSGSRRLIVTIEPALLLKGDIMVCGAFFIWPWYITTVKTIDISITLISFSCSLTLLWSFFLSVCPIGEVLSQTGSVCWEGLCVSTAVSYMHHSWSSALVWQRGTGWSLFRYVPSGTSQESDAKLIYFHNKTRAVCPSLTALSWNGLGISAEPVFFMVCFFISVVCVLLAVL